MRFIYIKEFKQKFGALGIKDLNVVSVNNNTLF